jgi:ATP-binding cassette subfamily B (MDR/TAP) protein 1
MKNEALLSKQIEGERAPFIELYRYSSNLDKVLLAISCLFAAFSGVCIPLYSYFQALLLDSVSDANEDEVSDSWIRNKISRGYSREEVKAAMHDKENSDNDFYMEMLDTAKIMLVLGLVGFISACIGLMLLTRVGLSQANSYRRAYLGVLLKKPISYYEQNSPANVCVSLDNECTRIEAATGEKLFIFIYSCCFISFGFALAFYTHPQLALVGLLQVPITGLGGVFLAMAMGKTAGLNQQVLKESGGLAEECLLELRSVQSMNAQTSLAEKYQEISAASEKSRVLLGLLAGVGWGLIFFGVNFGCNLTFLVGSMMKDDHVENWITEKEIGPFEISLIANVLSITCATLGNIAPCAQAIVEGKVAAHVMITAIEGDAEPDGDQSPELSGTIELKDLRFRYPTKPEDEVLKGVSLSIKSGQTAALVGESGSGKSTIMALILQYYQPTEGSVSFDGLSANKISLKKLRSQMSLVSQEPLLFNLSIKENIRLGQLTATDAEIEKAAEMAGVMSYVGRLPQGLNTNVGTKGSFLSGGQKQRIGIARAILKNPKILLLDEATSSLDNKTEARIMETLKQIGKDRTTLIIAQRLKTITHADFIFVFKHGSLIEQGTHESLLAQQGNYFSLYSRQNPLQVEEAIDIEAAKAKAIATQIQPKKEGQVQAQGFKKTRAFKNVVKLLRGNWGYITVAILLNIAAGFTYPLTGYYFGESIYYYCTEDGEDMLNDVYEAFIAQLVISSAILVIFTFNNFILTKLSLQFVIRARRLAFEAMLHYDQTHMDEKADRCNELTNVLTVGSEMLHSMGGPVIGFTVMVVTALVTGVIIATWLNWQLGLVLGACMPLFCIGLARGFIQNGRLTSVNYQSNRALAADVILNVKQVYSYNLQEYFLDLYMTNTSALAEKTKIQSIQTSMLYGLQILCFYYVLVAVFWYGGWLIKEENLSYEKFIVIIFTELYSTFGMMLASAVSSDLSAGADVVLLVVTKIEQQPTIDSYGRTGKPLPNVKGKLALTDLSFSYANRDAPVLMNLSFILEAGRSLGICGSTGSGKSTIASMILRFYDPQSGAVFVDDVDVKELNVKELRNHIGWVPQEAVLFRGDIRYNLKLAKPDATDDDINQALKAAEAYEFIAEKGGLSCEVSFRSTNFSGGQKQRLALARGFLRKPAIMILDEGTSALDSESEHKVLQEIKKLDCTVVSIAHRMTTIEHCDKILVLELGQVVEEGNHVQLMALDHHYARLVAEGKRTE